MNKEHAEICDCKICRRSRQFKRHIQAVKTEEGKQFFTNMLDALLTTEEDLDYDESIRVPMMAEQLSWLRDEVVPKLQAKIERKNEALHEAYIMAEAIEKCSLEPDKVYIHAGRIKQAARQALSTKEDSDE